MTLRAPGIDNPTVRWIIRRFQRTQKRLEDLQLKFLVATGRQTTGIKNAMTRELQALRRDTRNWTENGLPKLFYAGANTVAKPEVSGVLKNALEQVKKDTFDDLAKATQFVEQDVKRMIREASKIKAEAHIAEGKGVPMSKRDLKAALEKQGVRFVDKHGRHWKLDRYAEVVIRTKTAQAYNAGTIMQGLQEGATEFEVFDGTGDKACKDANGSTWRADKCLANLVAHPNCRRAFAAVLP